ncbi:hypothetical protein SLEP1_g59509 [Rubroshorea leprosula]|uniref:BURP domain-containing protein n=1 Tax=Rubroshorea leprosula TaxID=152421 RepID=A0AAV5MTN3_9ROSI|nr:hypothetical protein SLEP1_g59509 [Rubroshorea leprosula]
MLAAKVGKEIPFSSEKFTEVLKQFSVKSGSVQAEIMKKTIEECEQPVIQGEERHCATSLESMIDFSTSKLGENVNAISTEVENQTQKQEYTIEAGAKKMAGEKSVVCHKQNYAHAVFYCHETKTRAYMVPLEGAHGTKAKAAAVCHTDTSAWNPKHAQWRGRGVQGGALVPPKI